MTDVDAFLLILASLFALFGILYTIDKHKDGIADWWGGWK